MNREPRTANSNREHEPGTGNQERGTASARLSGVALIPARVGSKIFRGATMQATDALIMFPTMEVGLCRAGLGLAGATGGSSGVRRLLTILFAVSDVEKRRRDRRIS